MGYINEITGEHMKTESIIEGVYGVYQATMSDGRTIDVNATGYRPAVESIIDSGMVRGPDSSFKSVKLIRQIPCTDEDFKSKERKLATILHIASADCIIDETNEPLEVFMEDALAGVCAPYIASEMKEMSVLFLRKAIANLQRAVDSIGYLDD